MKEEIHIQLEILKNILENMKKEEESELLLEK